MRTGSVDFSLNTVAKEAGFSVTTVFAYFATKNDLFLGVVADDLATLAREMHESYAFSKSAGPEVEEPVEAHTAEIVPPVELEAGPDAIVVPENSPEASTEETSVIPFALPQEPKAEKPADPPRVDAWLERRLRVFEKTLADVETRLAAVQKESGGAAAQVEENTKIFGARLDASEKRFAELSGDLSTRMSGAEKRLRDAQTELRTSLLNASMRIDQLEAAARNVAAQTGYVPPVEIAAPVAFEIPAPEAPAEKPLTAAADTYLSAARRAAKTAAALAEMEKAEKTSKYPAWLNRSNIAIAGSILIFFVLGAMVSYAVGENVGRSTPIRIVLPRSLLQHTSASSKTASAATPLDKLSALAAAGNPRAELLIGLRYLKGEGVAIDKREAAKWILKASAAHDPMAQYWTAELFQHGDGVSPDASEALRWYEAAAGQGNRQAMHDLGVAYAEGLGTQKDYDESARWFAKAAALGLTNSQFNLAVLYERGEGVKPDLAQAYKWYAIAAASGDTESKTRIDAIASQISESKLAAAKAEAAAFKPATPDPDANTVTLPAT
jgi:TPR repeat protein